MRCMCCGKEFKKGREKVAMKNNHQIVDDFYFCNSCHARFSEEELKAYNINKVKR